MSGIIGCRGFRVVKRYSIFIPFYGELPELVLELVLDDIEVYLDELEIQNPGMLSFGMTMEDFMDGVDKVRNRVIV